MREETTNTPTLPHEEPAIGAAPSKPSKSGKIEKATSKIKESKTQATAAASEFAGKAKQRLSDSSDAAKHKYVETREKAALKSGEAQQAVRSSFDRHPLTYAAGALVAGIAIGMALPRSRREKQALASSGRKLRDTAHDIGRDTAHAAEAATDAATDTFQEELSSAGSHNKQI